MADFDFVIIEILNALQQRPDGRLTSQPSSSLVSIYGLINSLEKCTVSLTVYQGFLSSVRSTFVAAESTKRGLVLRAIRICIQSSAFVKALIMEEFHWLIVESLEKDSEFSMERIQALKLMDKVRKVDPDNFPVAFGRSIISIANSKEDSFRKICVESLRELALANPALVASLYGFSTLVDAILEPITQELADNITLSILYLLNDPNTRRIVEPCVDLKMLLAPFTDLDSDPNDLQPKWKAAKCAFLLLMKSWVGIVYLVSDENALGMLVSMLRDRKVPAHIQDLLLDLLSEVFKTACFKPSYSTRRHRHEFSVGSTQDGGYVGNTLTPTKAASFNDLVGVRTTRAVSDTEMTRDSSFSSPGGSTANFNSAYGGGVGIGASKTNPRGSFSFFSGGAGATRPSISETPEATTPTASQNQTSAARPLSSYLFGNRVASPGAPGKAPIKRSSITGTMGGKGQERDSFSSPTHPHSKSNPPAPLERITEEEGNFAQQQSRPPQAPQEIDPIFSLLDNFSALLCCAFLHVNLIESLYILSTDARMAVAAKSRNLLVCFLRILSEVLPEATCADLLTNASLIDLAASVGPTKSPAKAHKSSQLLIDLAEAFSIMPLKQTSGAHASNLSAATPSVKGRNGSITNKGGAAIPTTTTAGNAATLGNVQNKSNFLPLNINTLFELAEEIKISTSSSTAVQGIKRYENNSSILSSSNARTLDVLNSLRINLTPSIDKTDFSKQMELSRVLGKEGKEPFKWDWVVIGDMLEYSFYHPDRLAEALRTKWIRRVSGFYRCSVDEKGFFCNLEWEPTNLQYLECACNLYSVLLRDEAGISFLTSDRRGMLFNEMAQEIDALVSSAASKNWLGVSTANGVKNVFRMQSCFSSMARELFTLLGKIVKSPGSKKLLEYTNIFEHLSRLGQHKSLDYITRLVITSLCLSDGGLLSRHLLQLWTTSPTLSQDFRQYLHNLLRIMIQSVGTNDSFHWSIEAVTNQLLLEDNPALVLYKAIEEAIHSRSNLKLIVAKRPKLLKDPDAQHIATRLAAVPEGIAFLTEMNWMENAMNAWSTTKAKEYVLEVEKKLSTALSMSFKELLPDIIKGVEPIPLKTPELVREIIARQGPSNASTSSGGKGGDSDSAASKCSDPNANLRVDLQGFLRVPWNIEVKLTNQNSQVDPVTANGEYLRVDSYLDVSDMASPHNFDITSDVNRIVKVRGVILDSKGNPCGQPIAQNKVILNTLLAGICPVSRTGDMQSSFDFQPQQRRRASTTTMMREELRSAGRSSFVSAVGGTNGGGAGGGTGSDLSATNETDIPITLGQEYWYDWSICRSSQRQGQTTELDEGMFAVTIPGEPVVWIFSRRPTNATGTASQRMSRAGSIGRISNSAKGGEGVVESLFETGRSNRMDTSRSGGMLYLVEVHYYFRIETGQGVFVPIPRHLYGELSRTLEGCAVLARRSIVYDLVRQAKQQYESLVKSPSGSFAAPASTQVAPSSSSSSSSSSNNNLLELRAALWSLGHIATTDLGYTAISNVDPEFIDWCIDAVCRCPYFNVRGTFFYVLGLLSRTAKGSQRLSQHRWDSTSLQGNSAVTMPRNAQVLFQRVGGGAGTGGIPPGGLGGGLKKKLAGSRGPNPRPAPPGLPYLSLSNIPSSVKLLTPFIPSGSVSSDLEVLNLIAKMPGVILYRESKSRLEAIRRDRPEIFSKHSLYVDVHRLLESYSFKLTARKEILALFNEAARLKPAGSVHSTSSTNLLEVKAIMPTKQSTDDTIGTVGSLTQFQEQ